MRIGVYQNNPVFGETRINLEKALEDLSKVEADLVVLPELFCTGYQFISRDEAASLSEKIPEGPSCRMLADLAGARGLFLVFGLAEKDDGRCYNSAAVVGPKGFVGKYRKTHLFAEEKLFFEPGDTGFPVFDIGPARIGVMICFDWLFPESARVLALSGADLICHPANLVLPHCQRAMITRSLENGVFTVTANRVGTESRGGKPPLSFTGGSQVVGPSGNLLTSLGATETGVATVEIDPSRARDKGITAQNDRIGDRRPEFYGRILET